RWVRFTPTGWVSITPATTCAHRHRFESLQHASHVIGDWIRFYNHRRPHQALNMKTPAEAFALAA
ncbi:integrase core domain-containing protein, partial [Castellaniella sp.]|uniref:integrase core domain-containing protein n=1 Tax=Castellaniella sp. TaxID=1955812 RepID=UPI002AFF1361